MDNFNENSNTTIEHQWKPFDAESSLEKSESKKEKNEKKKKSKKEIKSLTFGQLFVTCVAFLLTTVLLNASIVYVFYNDINENYVSKEQYLKENIKTTADNIHTIVTETGGSLTVSQVAEAVMPSVVAITSTSIIESSMNPFYGYGGSYQIQGAGSGIIVGMNDTELLLVTNNHVVEGTTSLSVQFTNDVSVDEAYVKGTRADNDIAVVAIPLDAIDDNTLSYISIATLGDSDTMKVGDGVIAIGNALGYGQSLTVGYLSAKDREITTDNTTLTVIQTDAAINGGNSGGALLNMSGEVIGINVAKSSASSSSEASVEGMGYAIPISQAKDIIEELSNRETRYPVAEEDKGYLGVKVMTSDATDYEQYNIPAGAYIREVVAGGPAEKAGLMVGDVIVAVDGQTVSSADELVKVLGTYEAGETVTLTVRVRSSRDYEKKEIQVTLDGADKVS
ncbi:MAG: trypsin-like peptidase domain-containing protein [Lachnospiraceae bacterium]|nr:trypsin-like peptidase domain-containing protein [Lachnospiraceae bacterium]